MSVCLYVGVCMLACVWYLMFVCELVCILMYVLCMYECECMCFVSVCVICVLCVLCCVWLFFLCGCAYVDVRSCVGVCVCVCMCLFVFVLFCLCREVCVFSFVSV